MTETWLRKGDTSKIAEIKELGYNIHHKSRSGRGGGVAFIYRKSLNVVRQQTKAYKTFEVIECFINSPNSDMLRLCCIYRPGTPKAFGNFNDFCNDFDQYLDHVLQRPGKPILVGDFNIHLEDKENIYTSRFSTITSSYGLTQHVNTPTHKDGGILDLVLSCSNIADNIKISDMQVVPTTTASDHFFISFSCPIMHEATTENVDVTFRNLNGIDIEQFKDDVRNSNLSNPSCFTDLEQAINLYNNELSTILEKHAPLKTKQFNTRNSLWWNGDCQDARRQRRKAERQHMNNKKNKKEESEIKTSLDELKQATKKANSIITNVCDRYYSHKLESCQNNPKKTYSVINHLMDKTYVKSCIPNNAPKQEVADSMKDFFHEKVQTIYSDIENQHTILGLPKEDTDPNISSGFCPSLSKFEEVSEADLLQIVSSIDMKSCMLDPIPVQLFVDCLPELTPILLYIVNQSLSHGVFPEQLKNAAVRPNIKNQDGDVNDYKNYRPISNLPLLSKILEKCVLRQLNQHLSINDLHAKYQSGYRKFHSCETATLRIYNDLLCITDNGSQAILLLLDLSAAFDTINHSILLKKLKNSYGFKDQVYQWFESYLTGRSFNVVIGNCKSDRSSLTIGVPQGSILGPILFILYTKDLETIAARHGFTVHLYADDTQLYIAFDPLNSNHQDLQAKVLSLVDEIKIWMITNYLKINTNKTELLVVSKKNITKKNNEENEITELQISHDEEAIESVPVAKSLGVKFDSKLSFVDHITSVIQSCNINLRNLRAIASKLSFELKKQLVHSLVFSKLDYCNGLLYGVPKYLIVKLQRVQNSAVRFLYGHKIKKWDHITPYLKEAHFLPVDARIKYKIALMTYKCINNLSPTYLTNIIELKDDSSKSLRTDDDFFNLKAPSIPNYTRTQRAFKYASPEVWNSLPYHLRSSDCLEVFKKNLKTHLFKEYFADDQ